MSTMAGSPDHLQTQSLWRSAGDLDAPKEKTRNFAVSRTLLLSGNYSENKADIVDGPQIPYRNRLSDEMVVQIIKTG